MMKKLIIISLVYIITHSCSAIRVEKVVVPRTAVTGTTIELQCHYTEEDDELYTLKWWRGEDQFYQYVPPKRSFFPTPGVRVDMNATTYANKPHSHGLEVVVLRKVGLDSAGVYKCEVMADRTFTTVSQEANMSVIFPPPGPPTIYGATSPEEKIRLGQKISLKCSIPPSSPPPLLSWSVNGKMPLAEWVNDHPSSSVGRLVQVISRLDFIVGEDLIDESYEGLIIECIGRQQGSSYHMADRIIRHPERTSYFWFFTRANGTPGLTQKSWNLLIIILIGIYLQRNT